MVLDWNPLRSQTLILIPLPHSTIEFHPRTLTLNGWKLVKLQVGRSEGTKPTEPASSNGYFTANDNDLDTDLAWVRSSSRGVVIRKGTGYSAFVNNVLLSSPKEQTLDSGDELVCHILLLRCMSTYDSQCLGTKGTLGKAVVARVFIGKPEVILQPVDGCTARFKASRTLSLKPGKAVVIGGTLLRAQDKGSISPLDKHAKIGINVFIQDLGEDSPNGTTVNSTALKKGTPHHLENGDIVRMGSNDVEMDLNSENTEEKTVEHAPIIVRVKFREDLVHRSKTYL